MLKNTTLFFIVLFLNSCAVGRFIIWNFADVNDHKKFKNAIVHKPEIEFKYYKSEKELKVSTEFKKKFKFDNFDKFLAKNKTSSFLIIRNDTILYENYFNNYADTSLVTSFSIAKSFVSALVGIAIDEKFIHSDQDFITDYIIELKENEGFNKITIRDLLDMRSGIKCNEDYISPFSKVASLYYGVNILKVLQSLKIKNESDKNFEYQSVNTQLLGLIVERATDRKLYTYLEEKIWKPLGMESDVLWSIDSKKNDEVKSFCCMTGRTRDFAKFGTLYLKNGVWNNKQIIPKDWIEKTTHFTEKKNGFMYQNQWWHFPMDQKLADVDTLKIPKPFFVHKHLKDDAKWVSYPNDIYYAQGHLGQYIINFPKKNLTIVRFGKNYSKYDEVSFYNLLSLQF